VIFCLRSPAWAAVAGGRPEKCKKRPGRSLSAHWRHQFYTGAVDDRTVPSLFSEAEGEGGGGAFQSHGPFPSQHSSRWPSAKDPENRSLRRCQWPLRGGGGLPMVFWKGGPEFVAASQAGQEAVYLRALIFFVSARTNKRHHHLRGFNFRQVGAT
jgi:hypothetical protein